MLQCTGVASWTRTLDLPENITVGDLFCEDYVSIDNSNLNQEELIDVTLFTRNPYVIINVGSALIKVVDDEGMSVQ